ncbi:MAG: hypothetical protein HW391_1676 [Chloroflexi bacterium]|nr:hypothetical protein [Chloroflexota bacterium]
MSGRDAGRVEIGEAIRGGRIVECDDERLGGDSPGKAREDAAGADLDERVDAGGDHRIDRPDPVHACGEFARRVDVGFEKGTASSTLRIAAAASAIRGECAATLTGRTMARLAPSERAISAPASMAARSPETTTWPGAFRFATPNVPLAPARATSSGIAASSRPMIAAIAPSLPWPDACIWRPRSRTSRTPSSSEMTSAATMAEYWPMECPAANRGAGNASPAAADRSRSAARKAMDVARSAGWAFSVRFSVSSGPLQASSLIGSPRAAFAAAKTAAAAGETWARAWPIPTDCDPWPGKT